MKNQTHKKSIIILIFLAVILLASRFLLPRWETHDVLAILSWDVMGYYMYLPSIFVYQDLFSLEWVPHILETYRPTGAYYQAIALPHGGHVFKYPMGLSVMYLPFFLLGHFFALISAYPADGFSAPYQFAIGVGSIFYAILGLAILRKVLLRYFSDNITALTLLLLVLGTNYFQYVSFDGALTHNYLLTLYAAVLWLTIKWHGEQRWKYAIPLGLIIGLAVLTRPSEAVAVLIPLLWPVNGKWDIQEKWKTGWSNKWQVLATGLLVCAIFFLQMVYWKAATGSWFFYSYEDQGFSWLSPHLDMILWHFRKGWWIYTPLMFFAVIGFGWLFQKHRGIFWPLLIYFLVNIYIVSSWDVWWYGGSFGMRALIQSYAVMAFPLAALLAWTLKRRWTVVLGSIAAVVFISLNLFQTWQYHSGILPDDGMNRHYYFAIFGKTSLSNEDKKMMDISEYLEDDTGHVRDTVYTIDFEPSEEVHAESSVNDAHAFSGNYSFRLTQGFSPGIKNKIIMFYNKEDDWLRAGVWYYDPHNVREKVKLVISFEFDGEPFKWQGLKLENLTKTEGDWHYVQLESKIPDSETPRERFQIYVWNQSDKPIYIDKLQAVWLCPRK